MRELLSTSIIQALTVWDDKFETDKLSMDAGFTSFLGGWIVDHIMTEDRKCGEFLNRKSIY